MVHPTGSPVGTSMVSWMAPPHIYLKGKVLVIYVGSSGPVIDLLAAIMGPQFAGADSSTVDANSYADDEVRSYLALMRELNSYLSAFTSGRSTPEFALEQITTITSQLEGYMEFFAALEGEEQEYVSETYGDDLQRSAERVASSGMEIYENTGNEVLADALARIPAFAVASVTTGTTTTNEPVIVPAGSISTLLFPGEVAALADGVELTTRYIDLRSMAANVDPAQVENMDSFESLSFDTADGFIGLTLTTIKFDSEGAAADHLALVSSEAPGMQELSATIGDAAFYAEVNEGGFGSMVFFKKGVWTVMLHTTHPDGTSPLVDLAGVEALARTVADRI